MKPSSKKASEARYFPPEVATKKSWPPNYVDVLAWRQRMLRLYKADKAQKAAALEFYSKPENAVKFVCHWLDTHDTRKALGGVAFQNLPFVLFESQGELVRFFQGCLEDGQNGLVDKSRDMGVTWIACAFSVWLWRFVPGADVGWGSRKQELVDKLDDPKSVFYKIRRIIRRMPRVFWPEGFDPGKDMSYLRIVNPENGSTITGEGGDNIGRGGRTLIYFKDESAHYEHPESIEAALMDNTNVQIDISTHNGVGTVFDRKLNAGQQWRAGEKKPEPGTTRVFVMDWSDHPGKTPEWHAAREKAARDSGLLHLFKQEVDRDPTASLQGVIIPQEWVRSAIDAHVHLGFEDKGGHAAGFDPADEGADLHALARRKGVVLRSCDDWGQGDVGSATREVIRILDGLNPISVQYDCIGIGAGTKSEVNRLQEDPKTRQRMRGVSFVAWDAGLPPINPLGRVVQGDGTTPLNEDFYANLKAQGWWELRLRFERVHRMRTEKGVKFPVDKLISIDGSIPKVKSLMRELSQPVMKKSGDLRLLVDKKPEGARSPNMADAVMMCYHPAKTALYIPSGAAAMASR